MTFPIASFVRSSTNDAASNAAITKQKKEITQISEFKQQPFDATVSRSRCVANNRDENDLEFGGVLTCAMSPRVDCALNEIDCSSNAGNPYNFTNFHFGRVHIEGGRVQLNFVATDTAMRCE